MPVTLDSTPGGPAANSYLTLAEALLYYESRGPLPAWEAAPSQEAVLMQATRLLDAMFSGVRSKVTISGTSSPQYVIAPMWTGRATAPETQALCWPRVGMMNRNGAPIPDNVIPLSLKEATAEFAGQLAVAERSLDNTAAVQGITNVKAGSVSVSFAGVDGVMVTKVIPDVVTYLLVPSWYTQETVEGSLSFEFEVIE
jgi:hypothetical protein